MLERTTSRRLIARARSFVYRLFDRLDTAILRRPTFKALLALQDNYNPQTGVAERDNAQARLKDDRRPILLLLADARRTGRLPRPRHRQSTVGAAQRFYARKT